MNVQIKNEMMMRADTAAKIMGSVVGKRKLHRKT